MRPRWLVLALPGILAARSALGVSLELPPPRDDPAASVYRVSEVVDAAIITATGMGTLLPYLLAPRIIDMRCPCDPGEVNSLDRHAIGNHNAWADHGSDVLLGLVLAAPPVADAVMLGWSVPLLEDLTVFAEALTVNGVLVTAAKYATQRPLPRVYAGDDPALASSPGGYRSFYSGHVSITFAALGAASMTLGYRYGRWWLPWTVTAATGVAMAVARVAAGRHFPSDVAVGAVAGAVVGVAVPWAHHRRRPGAVAIVPTLGGATLLVSF